MRFSDEQIQQILAEYRAKYPPLISVDQAIEISLSPKATIYDWSSRQLFDAFKTRVGRRILLGRDEFVLFILRQRDRQ